MRPDGPVPTAGSHRGRQRRHRAFAAAGAYVIITGRDKQRLGLAVAASDRS
jgi:hypothetical protein